VTKTGDARVGLVGFPSVGKSTLLSVLTGTESEAAAYEFTTLTCIPGVIQYKGAKIQLLDLPGIIEGAKDGKGRGRQVISTARTCGLILITLDATKPLAHKLIIEKELEGFGMHHPRAQAPAYPVPYAAHSRAVRNPAPTSVPTHSPLPPLTTKPTLPSSALSLSQASALTRSHRRCRSPARTRAALPSTTP
jgi:50S ribosome-binding GTPase